MFSRFIALSPFGVSWCCCSVTQSCSTIRDPIDAACQASLSLTTSQSLPKFMYLASVMPSSYLFL